jgi:DNA primase
MSGRAAGDDQPDLAAEARFWREWNTAVFERDHSHVEAAAIAARLSPDPNRIAAVVARAETASALSQRERATAASDLVRIHADAGRFFQSKLEGSWVPEYMSDRGLGAVFLPSSPWKIGYAPDSWTALTTHLRGLGYSDDTLLRSGLVAEGRHGLHDRFRDRLMIPLRRAKDRVVVGFIGRRPPDADDDHGPKYLNSPNTGLYTKGHVLLGLAEGRRFLEQGAQPVLVEGPMDAIAVSIAGPGRYVGVAPCGTALTGEQAAELARAADLSGHGVRLALDPDDAGRKAALKAYARLSQVTEDITCVKLPNGIDPAEMLEKQGPRPLRDALMAGTHPLADLVIDARIEAWERDGWLEGVESQFGAIRAAGKAIAAMSPREAGRQMGRVTKLFTTRYHWASGEATRELIDAVERELFPKEHETTSAHDPANGLPPQAATAITNGTAPSSRTASPRSCLPTSRDLSARARAHARGSQAQRG